VKQLQLVPHTGRISRLLETLMKRRRSARVEGLLGQTIVDQ